MHFSSEDYPGLNTEAVSEPTAQSRETFEALSAELLLTSRIRTNNWVEVAYDSPVAKIAAYVSTSSISGKHTEGNDSEDTYDAAVIKLYIGGLSLESVLTQLSDKQRNETNQALRSALETLHDSDAAWIERVEAHIVSADRQLKLLTAEGLIESFPHQAMVMETTDIFSYREFPGKAHIKFQDSIGNSNYEHLHSSAHVLTRGVYVKDSDGGVYGYSKFLGGEEQLYVRNADLHPDDTLIDASEAFGRLYPAIIRNGSAHELMSSTQDDRIRTSRIRALEDMLYTPTEAKMSAMVLTVQGLIDS